MEVPPALATFEEDENRKQYITDARSQIRIGDIVTRAALTTVVSNSVDAGDSAVGQPSCTGACVGAIRALIGICKHQM